MKISIPEDYKELQEALPPFENPDFVKLMPQFIKRAGLLNEKVLNALGSYQHLGIVGIGGSQVQPYVFRPLSDIDVIHLEVPDPYSFKKISFLEPEKTRIVYISRSGTTKEVLSFIPYLQNFPSLVVTNGGELLKVANQWGWHFVSVEHDVSGRFAIQNELGVVPMIAMGLNPINFLSSLKNSYEKYFKKGSIAEEMAISLYNLERSGLKKMRILPSGIFTQGLGILLTQLINESVPKKIEDEIDATLHLMPRSAHSDLQRWYGGKPDSYICSLMCSKYEEEYIFDTEVSKDIRRLIPGTKAKVVDHLNITSKAVDDTFPGPVFRIILEKDSIEELGQCVGFFHALTVRLSQIKGSNPFDQPAVQQYKNKADEIYRKL